MTKSSEPSGAAEFEATLQARVPGYLPGWQPVAGGPGAALLAIAARFEAVVTDRLDRAPTKNKLAFLDMLGVSLLPAQAARAPVVFTARPGLGNSRVPAGSQIGASVSGVEGPLVFETERDIALVEARLVQVATVWPGRDAWADHTEAVHTGAPCSLFTGPTLRGIDHELYIAHEEALALSGSCEVRVQIELATPAEQAVATAWEYWDGTAWRGFAPFVAAVDATDTDSVDGTAGFTRSGTVVLKAEGAGAARTTVNWVDSHWIRARTTRAVTPDRGPGLPSIDRVLVSSVIAPPRGALTSIFRGGGAALRHISMPASGLMATCPDPAEAWVVLSRPAMGDVPAMELRHAFAAGAGSFGPFTAEQTGTWTLTVTIPGYTSERRTVTLSPGGAGAELYVGVKPHPNLPDAGLADGLKLELSKPFLPFGAGPQPGSAFYLAADAPLAKPGAVVTLAFEAASAGLTSSTGTVTNITPALDAQYFDGDAWQDLGVTPRADLFTSGGEFQFVVPADLRPLEVGGVEHRWIRFRITERTFGVKRLTEVSPTLKVDTREVVAPVLAALRVGWYFRSPALAPTACATRNDFTWVDHTAAMPTRGRPFQPFTVTADATPALYLGFDQPVPADVLGLYCDIAEVPGEESGPMLQWEAATAAGWAPVTAVDETAGLCLPGAIRVLHPGDAPPVTARGFQTSPTRIEFPFAADAGRFRSGDVVWIGDDSERILTRIAAVSASRLDLVSATAKTYPHVTVTVAGPARFGSPAASWLRARLRADGAPRPAQMRGLHVNAVWAAHLTTRRDEVLGSSDGNPNQSFSVRYPPLLPGQVLEVLELAGARAAVDLAHLTADVVAAGGSADDVRAVADRRTGAVLQVWVRWVERPDLVFSGPADRHYTVERSRGLVGFGDDRSGRIPPALTDGIVMRSYRSGGGRAGNVPLGALTQILAGVPAAAVTNVRAAEGGADGEKDASVLHRGPASVAARGQALTRAHYEVLAREASPAVAVARVVPATDAAGYPATGHVRVIVIPDSAEPRPEPSFGLRLRVLEHLRSRCPAAVADRIHVTGPTYHPVGVLAEIVPQSADAAGPVVTAASSALAAFLHPVTGGPAGDGWSFGRAVHASDVARVLSSVPGLDFVRTLELLVGDVPVGDVVTVPAGRVVVAGEITVRLAGGE